MLNRNEIKHIQRLKSKKHRQETGLFVAEGSKVVHELKQSTFYKPVHLYVLPQYKTEGTPWPTHLPCTVVSQSEMEQLSQLQSPPDALAVIEASEFAFRPFAAHQWSVVLDGLQDPGNLGTIIRIADWFGISAIYATDDTVDCYNPKVVQSSMGSLFRTQVMYGPCHEWLGAAQVPVYATGMQGENIWNMEKLAPGILVIGHEGQGIRAALLSLATRVLHIPKLGNAESLNAGVATGIVLSHLLAKQ
jgi:RNA methyltransferase, TrmH family